MVLGVAFSAALIAYYVVSYLIIRPPAVSASGRAPSVSLTLQTVASLGTGPHPDWVSYLAKNPQGRWVHSTVMTVPANSLVRITIYQYDTATGLRNPYWGAPQGTVGPISINGKPDYVKRACEASLGSADGRVIFESVIRALAAGTLAPAESASA